MTTVAVEELPEKLDEVLEKAQRGEKFTITRNDIAVAFVGPALFEEEKERKPRVPGSAVGKSVFYMAEDFDEPMEEFAEYM